MFGIIIFLISAPLITQFYPGGSINNANSIGFDWSQNYWCNLFNSKALNDVDNSARPFAISSTIFMFFSLLLFFYFFDDEFGLPKLKKIIIKYFGIASMLIAPFVMTQYHDIAVVVSGSLSSIAFLAIFHTHYKNKHYFLLCFGICWAVFFTINYLIYFSNIWIEKLPVIQKISFLTFYFWIILTNSLYNKRKSTTK